MSEKNVSNPGGDRKTTETGEETFQEFVRLTKATSDHQEMELQQEKAMEAITKLQKDRQACQDECSSTTLRKEKAEQELQQLHREEDEKHQAIRELSAKCEQSQEEQLRLQEKLQADRTVMEAVRKNLEDRLAKNAQLALENEQTAQRVEHLSLENQQRTSDLKTSEEETETVRQEISRLELMKENNQKKLHQLEDLKMESEHQRDMLKSQTAGLETEIEFNQKQMKIDNKAIRELMREKDILNKNLITASTVAKKQLCVVKLHEQSKKNLEQEIKSYKDEARKQLKIIAQHEKERDHYISEADSILDEVHHITEETRERKVEIFEYRKKIGDVEKEVKHQQHLYEAVRSDKTIYSKQLNEMQGEMSEMKTQLKMMQCDADQLKEELHEKGSAFEKETLELLNVEDENTRLKVDLDKLKEQVHETKHVIEAQEAEESKLLKVLDDTDTQLVTQRKQLSQVIRERDHLGRQLVERDKELESLYMRMKIQQDVMSKREMLYNEMSDKTQVLKDDIKKLAKEKKIVDKEVSNIEDLRREVNHLQKDLLQEQMMCKVLEEDIQIPKNVHRWRNLKICDPATYELHQKIHHLQKCLSTTSKQVEETEVLLQQRQKSYVQLKQDLARQPGPEVAEKIKNYQQTLRDKKTQLRELRSNLDIYRSQKKELNKKIDFLDRELGKVKKEYIAKKRRELQSSTSQKKNKAPSSQNVVSVQDSASLHLTNIASDNSIRIGLEACGPLNAMKLLVCSHQQPLRYS
ncbi:hypothetical protein COCON_G00037610 [Conger conger]|uniref:Cilia- and flagella-associated protein 58 central coiled coil domain-containing protein n=1 Tax=Conger conger TaxID=82655 RepID=A0A9Q1I7T2_CONCO|nr:hypothetical protein COCON_G00037610 [Conger conger]